MSPLDSLVGRAMRTLLLALFASLLAAPASRAAGKIRPPDSPMTRVAGCIDDALEPDDACLSAAPISPGIYNSLVSISGDDDWYSIYVQRASTVNITLTFINASGDIDMRLDDGCGGPVLASSSSTSNSENIIYTNTGVGRTFYFRVYLFSGACNG